MWTTQTNLWITLWVDGDPSLSTVIVSAQAACVRSGFDKPRAGLWTTLWVTASGQVIACHAGPGMPLFVRVIDDLSRG